jgi:hypothetical protein
MLNRNSIITDPREQRKKYIKLHAEIAKKYGTADNHFSHKKVGFVRDSYFNLQLDKKKTIKRAEEMMYRNHDKRKHSITWYLYLTNFLRKCTDEEWKDINRLIT